MSMNNFGLHEAILIKTDGINSPSVPLKKISYFMHGPGYLILNDVHIIGPPSHLYELLTELAKQVKPSNYRERLNEVKD